MTDLLQSTLLKVLAPAVGIGVMLFVARRRKLSCATDLGLRAPLPAATLLWVAIWISLIALEEFLTRGIAGTQAHPWPAYPQHIVMLRILALGVLGPVAEELLFRGVLMGLLRRTRLGVRGAILLTAVGWAVIHVQYQPLVLALIVVDGLALGMARHFSRSLHVPIAMHMMGNLFSIWQSLSAASTIGPQP